MGLIELHYQEGQTPLDEDEKDGLLLASVTTRGELDEFDPGSRISLRLSASITGGR